jgi:hypothetical protein
MSEVPEDRLYELLPALYRVRDADLGEPLRALLRIIEREFGRVQGDIAGLYDNWFIETCEEWVVPYIGDLLGVRPIRSIDAAGVSLRGYVANTLAYRRRKGTALVLEQLARDATGWPAHAVEFFQRLATAQHMNHLRPAPATVPDLRNAANAQLAGTAFGGFAHVPEMRRIATRGGRYAVPNVGLFLWRLQSYPIGQRARGIEATDFGSAREIVDFEPNTFAFHPVGVDMPLFNVPVAEDEISHLAEEHNVPEPLRRLVLARELQARRGGTDARTLQFMSADAPAFRIFVRLAGEGGLIEVPPERIYMCCIPQEEAESSPPVLAAAVDPERGRLRFPAAFSIAETRVSFAYGFPGDLGGGPYDRISSVHAANSPIDTLADGVHNDFLAPTWQAGVSHLGESGTTSAPVFATLRAAVDAWNALPPGHTGVIAVMDSLTETLSSAAASPPAPLEIRVRGGSRLLVIAAHWPRKDEDARQFGVFTPFAVRPHCIGEIQVRGTAAAVDENAGVLVMNGLLLEGGVQVVDGSLATLLIQHSTIVPGSGRLDVTEGNARLAIGIERSIVGAIDLSVPVRALAITDSIVEGSTDSPAFAIHAPETPCTFNSVTVVGRTRVRSLEASDCIFVADVEAIRRQAGCVRFSFVPDTSTTPRRYRCQPELALETAIADEKLQAPGDMLTEAQMSALRESVLARVRPLFSTLSYGGPHYGQLDQRCALEIRTGAADGSEMGAYRFLQQPHREANLHTVLQEYLRFGLQAGLFFVT